MRKLVKWILYFLALVFSALLAGAYLSRLVSPDKIWQLSFFGLVFPVIFILSVILLILLIIGRNKAGFLLAAFLVAGWFPIKETVSFIRKTPETQSTEGVKIMSYNVRIFDNFKWSGKDNSGQMMLDFVANEKPDIICFQEFMAKSIGDFGMISIKSKLRHAPYVHTKYMREGLVNKVGLAIFSKYPIIEKGGEYLSDKGQLYIYTDLKVKQDTIRLFNIHLESNHFNQSQINLIDSLISNDPRDKKSEYIDILKNMKKAYIIRSSQARMIKEVIKESPYPVVVAGDFNDTPVSYTYNTISGSLEDAFVGSGKGLGATYKKFMLPLRIDYILHDKDYQSREYTKHNVDFSDHKPIHAVLDIGGFKRKVR